MMGLGRVMRLCCVCIGCHSGLIAGACMCNISSTTLATSAMLLLIHGSDSACTAQAHAALGAPFLVLAVHTKSFGIPGFTVVLDEEAMLAGYGRKSGRDGLWCTCEHFCWLGLSCNSFRTKQACMHACGRGAGWCTLF
jgi:hypothetical protein